MDSRILIFYRQYLQQVDSDMLSYPPDNLLLDPMIQFQMYRYMFNVHLMFPSQEGSGVNLPRASYQKRVCKELTRRIEAAIRNPDEDVGIPLVGLSCCLSYLHCSVACCVQFFHVYPCDHRWALQIFHLNSLIPGNLE